MDFKGWKKEVENKDTVTMRHEKGHMMTLALKALPKIQREQLKRLPIMENSGVKFYDEGTTNVQPTSQDARQQVSGSFNNATGSKSIIPRVKALLLGGPPSAEAQTQSKANGGVIQHFDEGTPDAPVAADQPDTSSLTTAPAPAPTQNKNLANAYNNYQQELNTVQQQNQNNRAMIDKAHQGWDDFNNNPDSQIDAKQYQKNMDLGDKVSTGIGLFLGGFSVPFGGHNFAQDFLNQQIDRNIAAQKENYQHQKNVWGAAHELFGDNQVADNFAKTTALDQVNNLIRNSAMSLGPDAKVRAADLINKNNAQKEALKNHSAKIMTNKQQAAQAAPAPAPAAPAAPMSFMDKIGQYLPTGGPPVEAGTMPPPHKQQQQQAGLDTTVPDTGPLPQFHIDEKGINNSQYLGSQPNPPPNEITPGEVGSANSEIGKAKQFNEKIPLIHQNFGEMWKNRSDSNAALKYISNLGVNLEGVHLQPPDMTSWNEGSKNYYRAANRVRQELGALVGNGALTNEQAQTVMTNLIKEGDTPEDYKNILKQVDGNLLSTLQTPVLDKYKKIKRPKIEQ